MKPTLKNLINSLVGKSAQADHPITCANPDSHFIIKEAKLERGLIFCMGEKTIWFSEDLLVVFDD